MEQNENESANTYQVFISNIAWNPESTRQYRSKYDAKKELPESMTFDIPEERYAELRRKSGQEFDDAVETYIYNTLSGKFGHEVLHCQIYLQLDR